jgi:hypothetical protein
MSVRSLQQGIDAVQRGNHDEGARLIRLALKDGSLDASLRATAWMWLAETKTDMTYKLDCYQQAHSADPTNQLVNQRLSTLLSAQLPKDTSGTGPMPPVSGNTPSQGMPPLGGNTPSQGMPPINENTTSSFAPIPPQSTPPYPQQPTQYPYPAPQQQPYAPPNQATNTGNMPQQYDPQTLAPYPNAYGNNPYNNVPPTQSTGTMPATPGYTPSYGMPPAQSTGTMPSVGPMVGGFPVTQTQTQRMVIQGAQRSLGIFGGPNGRGTGVFVTRDGLIATTRHVAGGESELEIELLSGQRLSGKVIRAFPAYDLALIQTNVTVSHVLPVTQLPIVPENTPLVAISHRGETNRTVRRPTKNQPVAAQWFPTMITHLPDAGGDPVFDSQSLLVGMMTRNAMRGTGYLYGLHITQIYKCVEMVLNEMAQLGGHGQYCRHCGTLSRAGAFGAYYCEVCGGILPNSYNLPRHPQPNMSALYGENMNRACPNCRSTVGYHNGICLRCGTDVVKQR